MAKYAVILACLLAGACTRGNGLPTAPETPDTITLTLTAGAMIDNFQQLTATLVGSDGSQVDVTTLAAWRSDAPAIATVSSSGLVHVIADGTVEIEALYNQLKSTLRVSSQQVRFTISGRVSAAFPAQPGFVARAKVEVVAGASTGEFAIADSDGFFTLRNLPPGPVGLRIAEAGYEPWRTDLQLDADITINPVLTKSTVSSGAGRR